MNAAYLAVAAGLAGVVIGQLLPEYFARRRAIRDLYDSAIRAVATAQAARHGVSLTIPRGYLKAPTATTHRKAEHELSLQTVRSWLDATAAARTALAALHPYSPDLKRYWDKFELTPAETDEVISLLDKRRRRPRKRHGLSQ
jgi:hypothetical protein